MTTVHEERVQRAERLTRGVDRPVGALLGDLTQQLTLLISNEFALAKAEAGEKVSRLVSDVAAVAIGGAIAFAGFIVLLLAAVAGLAEVLPPNMALWLSPLIVGVVVIIVGYALLQGGISRARRHDLALSRTTESMIRNKEFAQDTLRRDRDPLRRDDSVKEDMR